ncbi:MAG: bifunctional dihydroorotate dehydrogenase B NAD binding subunit/NADPH-dependent glutamate synthase [Salinivirgaceae bacterium]|nr:bifunctional dihydroorotate dehydrogenase B NAD binding subunit/NADPH-dependent glutamate synthase [Salinivirgaceae bacterium]MDD4745834.1 bifunctional dihydroorotate dehydrogenase B NAD binding subunit/NADPH-dependent glutamate synthase [Salinivirgaceae bacterium]MDY0280236.1 bifunctional dihydroorotate dehydrogenase B NAD binding subunit/NADPH-dependent glutamate synthase [Salinivirgaceae bacterium]
MYTILRKDLLAERIYRMDVLTPRMASSAKPGQFLIAMTDKFGERIPLTICNYDREKGTITIVFQVVGQSTQAIADLNEGESFSDFAGPLGEPAEVYKQPLEELKAQKLLFIGGGVGAAPVYPQVKWLHEQGVNVDVILGTRSKETLIMQKDFEPITKNLYLASDDGSVGFKGNATMLLEDLVTNKGQKYDKIIAIGPMVMMNSISELTKKLNIPTVVSLNTLMVCGAGMCGACRVTVDKKTKFACFDGPEFDAHKINFQEAMRRQGMYKSEEHSNDYKQGNEVFQFGSVHHDTKIVEKQRVAMRQQNPAERSKNFAEVTFGYNKEEAIAEASRCLECKNPQCVTQCPVSIDIPGFIKHIKTSNFEKAAEVLYSSTILPSVCGRVCPQEIQCEQKCILGIKGEPVAIGRLERFIGDWARENNAIPINKKGEPKKEKVAIIGSGPAGLTCAAELANMGYTVKIIESFHNPGGVLEYGIPEFRLPKDTVVKPEIEAIKKLGVEIETNVIVGKTVTIEELKKNEGYDAIFIGTGAGLPKFMNIPGENLNGVISANEFLTRNNLMKAFLKEYQTPIRVGKKVAVVGGGNVAMDAARTAIRLGAEVTIVYRRSDQELPARGEEVEHAKEEGVQFYLLTNPNEILGNEKGWVKGMKCIRMELGEPDASGRRSPVPIANSEFTLECDTVIMSLGTSPNPLIASTTKGLSIDKWHRITTDTIGLTSIEGVFAGGDVVTGSATVILAMGAGKKAAKAIHEYLQNK